MILYNGWFDLKPGVRDSEFVAALDAYLDHLRGEGLIAGWRLSRRALGLGPADLGGFHLVIECEDMAQLDRVFGVVSTRADPVESLHHGVNAKVHNVRFALYRDFPDSWRRHGEEKF